MTNGIYHKITPAQARDMMKSGALVLDVRNPDEYDALRLSGAVNIPLDKIRDRAEDEMSDKAMTILVYCRSGRRSARAARELLDMGYVNVFDFGGIMDWPYDVVSG